MQRVFRPTAAAAISSFFAFPAVADISAEDVWSDLQTYSASFGYAVTGETSREDSSLVVSNMTFSAAQTIESNSAVMTLDKVVFEERSNGSVGIELPTVIPVQITSQMEDGEPVSFTMDYIQSGTVIDVTGDPENILYTYSANSVSMQTSGINIQGLSSDDPQPQMNLAFNMISGTTNMTLDSQRRYAQQLSVNNVDYMLTVADPSSDESVEMEGKFQNIAFAGDTVLPVRSMDASDISAMLAAGLAVNGEFTFGENSFSVSGTAPNEQFSGVAKSQKGGVGVVMDANQLTYNLSQYDTDVEMTSNQFPVPINFGVAESVFKISLPVRESEEPQDFSLAFTLDGFTMSETLWGMFDPTGKIPRDPARVVLDLAGQAKLLFDFLNPDIEALQAEATEAAPFELEMVDINKLELSVAGAHLNGSGSFEFKTSPVGIPQPIGAVDLSLVGGNALIDTLVSTGMLPEQQAMGARMMLGLLAVPGGAPDTLNSKIEINEFGHVSANGQRIQ